MVEVAPRSEGKEGKRSDHLDDATSPSYRVPLHIVTSRKNIRHERRVYESNVSSETEITSIGEEGSYS